MTMWVRSWTAAVIAVLALTSIPEIYAVVQPSGVASADVCAGVGRRVSVSGCTNVADTVNAYVPPPADYAPLPENSAPTATTAAGKCLCWSRPANPCKRVLLKARLRACPGFAVDTNVHLSSFCFVAIHWNLAVQSVNRCTGSE